jgi:hypothetical protein
VERDVGRGAGGAALRFVVGLLCIGDTPFQEALFSLLFCFFLCDKHVGDGCSAGVFVVPLSCR